MSPTQFSLRNPLVVAGVAVALCLFGLFAYTSLGVAITPNVNVPQAIVTTTYPGADPATVEANVTRPIEDAIAALPNIDTNGLISTSSFGVSVVSVQFTSAANADLVAVDVQRVVNGVRANLPADADTPSVSKVDFNAQGVATMVLSGPQLTQLQDLAANSLQQQFNALPGVGTTAIRSGITHEVHVTVDQNALRARDLSINSVVNALQSEQLEVPAGTITQGTTDLSVYFDSLAARVDTLGDIVVTQTATGPVYLRDVASIQDTFKTRTSIVRVDGQEGISLVIIKLADANSISVVDAVKHKIDELNPQLPPGTHLSLVVDASTYTSKSFFTVRNALIEAVLATGFILLLFLHTWRSTLIVLVSIPVSLLSTLALMAVLHYNLNLLTMVALVVSVGILVDDSIVVLENIARHLALGKSSLQAAIDGRSEIGLAAVTITLVDVVVYVPMAVMTTGLPAQFLQPFAVVITAATLSSLLVSFTLTPMLARFFLHREAENPSGGSPLARPGRAFDRGFAALERGYEHLLRVSLPRRWVVIALGLAAFAAGIALPVAGVIGLDFFPSGDQSELDLTLTMPASTTLDATNAVSQKMELELRQYPEVRGLFSIVGQANVPGAAGALSGTNQAQMTVLLVPRAERQRSSADLAEDVRQRFEGHFPGAKIRVGMPNAFGFGGFGGAPIQVQVQGSDPAVVDRLATQLEQQIATVPGAVGLENSNDNLQTQLRAKIDWTQAADLGVSARDAGTALRSALDGFTSNANQFRQTGQTSIPIRVLTADPTQTSPADIQRLPVSGSRGVVQLGQFTTFEQARIPTSIEHVNRLRSVTIGVSAGQGHLVGDLQNGVQAAVASVQLPAGYGVTYAGQGQQGGSAFGDLARAMGMAVLLMYMLMMMLFGSLTLPLAVLMSLPLAMVGALGAMAVAHSAFTLFSMLGVAVLLGLVGKNAILLVDRTDRLRRSGMDRRSALLAAGPSRLRPIIMTTFSVMAALLPIATGLEEGSELLQSVALVLIGGLVTSTLLTLVFVPAMYTIFDDIQQFVVGLIRSGPRQWRRAGSRRLVPVAVPVPFGDAE
ncbi:MAG TPA: efflux RND transporter permease subunit [Chloroflexota bacterium]|nr:efflux RND transporter permease subunit [Chloroflexota bacterium]